MPDICMQHMCAIMLIDGIATFESAHDVKRMKDPKVLAVRRRIELVGDDALEKLLPSRQGIVELTLKDGRRLRHHTEHVRGHLAQPDDACGSGREGLSPHGAGPRPRRARAVCDSAWRIEKVKDLRVLRPLLQA
jgi:2-methylcitrate dehydratase PrpD